MTEDQKTDEVQAEAPKAAPAKRAKAETFPVADLIENAHALLGVESYVAAGALHTKTGTLSISQARETVTKWLASPISVEKE